MSLIFWGKYNIATTNYKYTNVDSSVIKYEYAPRYDNDNREITNDPTSNNYTWIKAGNLRDYIGSYVFSGGWWQIGPERHIRSNDRDTFILYQATVMTGNVKNKGSYISDVSGLPNTYPDNGVSGSYWYVKLADAAPTAPTGVICASKAFAKKSITVSWTASSDINLDAITYYIDYYNGTSWINVGNTKSCNYDYILPDISIKNAKFRVRANDGQLDSVYTESNVFEIVRIQISMNIDSQIRRFSNGYVKIDGTLKNMSNVYIKVNDTLKEI